MKNPEQKPVRKSWDTPTVNRVGTVAEILRGGGGKQSVLLSDSGDDNKPKGQG